MRCSVLRRLMSHVHAHALLDTRRLPLISHAPIVPQAHAKLGAVAGVANIELLLQDVEAADFPDGSFDFILCSNAMAYMQAHY